MSERSNISPYRREGYYALTASGRRQLEQHKRRWERISLAIASVLEGA